MATLAESFLADLEDLSDDEEPQQQQEAEAEGEDQDVSIERTLGTSESRGAPAARRRRCRRHLCHCPRACIASSSGGLCYYRLAPWGLAWDI